MYNGYRDFLKSCFSYKYRKKQFWCAYTSSRLLTLQEIPHSIDKEKKESEK